MHYLKNNANLAFSKEKLKNISGCLETFNQNFKIFSSKDYGMKFYNTKNTNYWTNNEVFIRAIK